jgi:hypothetical protein
MPWLRNYQTPEALGADFFKLQVRLRIDVRVGVRVTVG